MTQHPSASPRISVLLLGVTWLEVAVLLVAGGGLLIALPAVVAIWPWPLTPFNLRFLGALYSAALLAAFIQARVGRWAPARTVTLMIFVFTLVVTVCSFMHLDRFDFGKAQVWIWFLLYVGVCLNAGLHLWLYRRLPLAGQPPRSRTVLLVCAGILGVYGLALLLVPDLAARLWPWKIDRFHAQLYSVSFLTPAAGALSLRRCAARIDWFTLGVTLLAWGLLPMLALVVVDAQVHRVDWSETAVWAWLSLLGLLVGMGTWMLRTATTIGTTTARDHSASA